MWIEPSLQPLSGETLQGASSNIQNGARLDIAANGFWGGRYERTFFDVRIFNPHAPSHSQCSLASTYRKQEALKKRAYEQRIREVEHSSFTPLVFSATGGMAKEATAFYKRLASCLATKWEQHYSAVLFWLRARITFSFLCSAIQSIRGARSHIGHASRVPPFNPFKSLPSIPPFESPSLLILQFLNYNAVFDLSWPSFFSNLNIYLSILVPLQCLNIQKSYLVEGIPTSRIDLLNFFTNTNIMYS